MASVSVASREEGKKLIHLQHGMPRTAGQADRSQEAQQKELRRIQTYQALVEEVNEKVYDLCTTLFNEMRLMLM